MKTVVWDVDDVLNDLMGSWLTRLWLPEHPDCRVRYREITTNPPDEVLGISREEYLASLDRFRLSADAAAMEPNPAVLAWLNAHGAGCRHVALTARPLASAPAAAHWVLTHFGAWIRTFTFVPSWRPQECLPPYDAAKADYLQWLQRADVLIDDAPDNIEGAARLGIRGVLMPQPWNSSRLTLPETLELLTDIVAGQ